MKHYIAHINGSEFELKANAQIYECDCFVLNGESFYVYLRETNHLYVKPMNKTVAAFE